MTSTRTELLRLVDLQLEDRLTEDDERRIGRLLADEPQLVATYTEYICLHGQLLWDAGLCADPVIPEAAVEPQLVSRQTASSNSQPGQRSTSRPMLAVAASLVAIIGGWVAVSQPNQPNNPGSIAVNVPDAQPGIPRDPGASVATTDNQPATEALVPLQPLELRNRTQPQTPTNVPDVLVAVAEPAAPMLPPEFDDDTVVSKINDILETSWADQGLVASPPAEDSEWVRRVYLTLLGRVPTLDESQQFLRSKSSRKRQALIASVSENPERASHLAVVWTNLLVGRTSRSGVNRESLVDFLAQQFEDNKPWIQTVDSLITATGRNDQNGATNFLLAHLNNEATPATAVTARLFLGEQISCVQCHDHPFAKDIGQQHYWALNAFFKDTERRTVAIADASGGQNKSDIPWLLTDRPGKDPMTYYENRNGIERAALPAYDGSTIDRDDDSNRRQRLAKLLATDSESKVAKAMVNRMWEQFFGYGFTNPIDDMGPHAIVSHPELLSLLTEAFVKSNYDLQRLSQWIAGTRAWQSSSASLAKNASDDPASGASPAFSRVYVRRMTPEQVYQSIRVAIRSVGDKPVNTGEVHSEHRRDWVRQFAQAYDTDENDESLNFDGTIAQAMVMMNGDEVDVAIHQATKALASGSLKPVKSPTDALNRVALAMLTRKPTPREESAFRKRYRSLSQQSGNGGVAVAAAVEDMMWAYLNSSEFVLVH